MIVLGACLIHQAADQGAVQETNTHEYTMKEMLGTKQVYLLFIMLFTSCMSGLYLIGMVKDIGVQLVGLSAATAANAVAMVAIFNTLGRIILGPLSDKIGRLKIVTGTFVVMASSVLVLSFVDLNYGIYFVCVASVAFCFGGNITIFPAIVGDFFGMKTIVKLRNCVSRIWIWSACRFLYRCTSRWIQTNLYGDRCIMCRVIHYRNFNSST